MNRYPGLVSEIRRLEEEVRAQLLEIQSMDSEMIGLRDRLAAAQKSLEDADRELSRLAGLVDACNSRIESMRSEETLPASSSS